MKYNTLFAYVYDENGEYDTIYSFEGSPENISNFILTHNLNRIVMTDIGDTFVLSSSIGGFLDRVQDQKFLVEKLHPVIIPKQQGEVEVVPIQFLLNEDGYYVEARKDIALNEFCLLGMADSKYEKYGVTAIQVAVDNNKYEVLFPSSMNISDIEAGSIIGLFGYFMNDINNDENIIMMATDRTHVSMNALLINDLYIDTLIVGKAWSIDDNLLYLSDINGDGSLTFIIDDEKFLAEINENIDEMEYVAIQAVPLFYDETGETELAIAQLSIIESVQEMDNSSVMEQQV